MLVPGGKALMHNLSDLEFQTLYLCSEYNEASVRKSIDQVLQNNRKASSLADINDAFEGFGRVVRVCFAKDEGESFFLVNSTGQLQLTNGKYVWFKTE